MQGQTPSYVLTTMLKAPASNFLTTLANVKDELGLTKSDNDKTLTRYIREQSAAIASQCNRIFGLATWQDEFRPQRGVRGEGVRGAFNPLKLTHFPLAAAAVSFTGNTHSNLLIDGIASTSDLIAGMPVFGAGIPDGVTIKTVLPTGVMLSAVTTGTATAVSFIAGVSIVETIAGVSKQLVAGVDFQIDSGSLLPGDEGNGLIYRLNELGNPRTWPAAKIVVIYQAGYSLPDDPCPITPPLPPDLESVCIRLIVGRFKAKGRDPTLRSFTQPNLGSETYWIGSAPGQGGPYPSDIMGTLNNYRTPVIA